MHHLKPTIPVYLKRRRGVLGHCSKLYSGQPTNKTELLLITDKSANNNKDKLLTYRRHKIKITKLTKKYYFIFFTVYTVFTPVVK